MATSSHNCVYMNCSNNNRRNKDISFFSFPVTDIERVKEWQENCGNIYIVNMDIKELKAKLICEVHFPSKYVVKNSTRKLLTRTAVPHKCEIQEISKAQTEQYLAIGQHSKIYTRKRFSSNSDTDSEQTQLLYVNNSSNDTKSMAYSRSVPLSSFVEMSDHMLKKKSSTKYLPQSEVKFLTGKRNVKKKISSKCTQNCKRNKKTYFSVAVILMNLLKCRSKFVETFVNMQLFHGKNSKWTKLEQNLALSLYLKSPSTYKFMLYDLQFILPLEQTIQDWLKLRYLKPGLNRDLMNKLYIKARTMTKQEKIISLMFDEIKLKQQLEFDPVHDRIEGFEDLDGLRTSSKLANTALVFSIASILYNWKIPLLYYTSSGPINSVLLQKIVIDVIKKLQAMTFNPLVLVCNQESNKLDMLELLGATQENPVVNIHGQKIFTCFDTSFLLKDLRKTFMNTNSQILINKMPISCTHITKIFDTDDMSDSVIFSKSIPAVINSSTERCVSATAENTGQFLNKINCILEALKFRTLYHDPNKKQLPVHSESTINVLNMALEYFKQIEIWENNELQNDIRCIQGFQWTINSILQLWEHLRNRVKYLTDCINLNDLEQFFSGVRNTGEFSTSSTVKQLRIAIQHNININMQMEIKHFELHNHQNFNDRDRFVDREENSTTEKNINMRGKSRKEPSRSEVMEQLLTSCSATLETCSPVKVARYLAHRVITRYKCDNCVTNLIKGERYVINSHEHFQRPSNWFTNIISSLLQVFDKTYNNHKREESVSNSIYDYLRTYLSQNFSSWSSIEIQGHCVEHLRFILKLFIKMNVIRCVKIESENYNRKPEPIKPFKKIRVLQAELL